MTKYKARLVAKGCLQCPEFDYNETYSPVVQLETIRAILALVPIYGLKINQMDIKSAYLNRYISEQVYMKQPDGYEDGTGCICYLKKTLYGLKKARCEWNKEFDRQICTKGFHQLKSDPCAYILRNKEDLQ